MSVWREARGAGNIIGSERSCKAVKGWHPGTPPSVFNKWKVNNERAVNKQLWFNKLFILTILPAFAQRRQRTSLCFLPICSAGLTLPGAEPFTFWTAEGARVTPKKGRVQPLPVPLRAQKKEKGRDREMSRRGTEEDRKRVDRHGNEKRYFSQVDQIPPCTQARHEKINRKELFFIPWLKWLIYLKTMGWQIWNSQGKGKGIFEKSNRFSSILKAELWFSGNALRNQVVLLGFTTGEQSKLYTAAEGPQAIWNKNLPHFKVCPAWKWISNISQTQCSFSALMAPRYRLILFMKRCCMRQDSSCRLRRAIVLPGIFTVYLRRWGIICPLQ